MSTGITIAKSSGSTPASAPVGATLMKTGQTTSYRTGDDGDLEAGRATSFTVLASNNPFGNTNRFTDELGGQTYTNNIVIDWSTYNGATVTGWYKDIVAVNQTWNTAIDNALLVSVGTFTTGWRLPNATEMMSIFNYGATTHGLEYVPFSNTNSDIFWTSTTLPILTNNALRIGNATFALINAAKTTATGYRYMACRTFTVTGTTLT
jgi:hypothetical protein